MKNKPGIILYKCRRCGTVFNGYHVPDIFEGLIELTTDYRFPQYDMHPTMLTTHACADGRGHGIADCIGIEYEEK